MLDFQVSYRGPQWFCLVVDPARIRQIENELAALGYRSFVPKVRRWVSHARVKKVVERPLLGRYLFLELDYPKQSFASAMAVNGIEYAISVCGVPWPMPRREVDNLFDRYLSGEFDETALGPVPVGARVKIVEGKFENWLATVTGHKKGGALSLKILGQNLHVNKAPARSVRPAFGFDLKRDNPEPVG